MSRSSSLVLGSLAIVLATACNQTPIVTPVRSFDRPSDAAITCVIFIPNIVSTDPVTGYDYGSYVTAGTADAAIDGHWEARPPSACAPLPTSIVETHTVVIEGTPYPFTPELRVLVANSARGEVALVNVPQEILVDLDRQNPGYNFIPTGRLTDSIRATGDGCFALAGNSDSCDLALLDLTVMNNMPERDLTDVPQGAYSKDVVHRLQLTAGGRLIPARPTAIEMVPVVPGSAGSCQSGQTYHAWVALPGCQAVVEVPFTQRSGADPINIEISRAIQITSAGATILADPTQLNCPAECTADDTADGGMVALPDGGMAAAPQSEAAPGTIALDLEDQTMRLVIGDLYGETLTIVPLSTETNPATNQLSGEPQTPRTVQLEAGTLGVSRVRISPRTPAGKFIYAVARDGTVHVVDLDLERECETNPDPTQFASVPPQDPLPNARRLGCLPVGDPATPRRSPNALGPGIALPAGASARDVSFVHLDVPVPVVDNTAPQLAAEPQLMVGDFAWIAGSDGRATVVNVYDACPQPNDPQYTSDGVTYYPACAPVNIGASRVRDFLNFGNPYPIEFERLSHHLRSGEIRFLQPNDTGDSGGTPRTQSPDSSSTVTITIDGAPVSAKNAAELKVVSRTIASTDLTGDPTVPAKALMTIDAPDPTQVRNETWSLAWEGVLPGSLRTFGKMCGVGDDTCPRGSMVDAGATLCAHGVLPGDKLELTGCATDDDCLYTQLCVHDPAAPPKVINGLCLDRDDNGNYPVDGQETRCSPLMRAQRRYRIVAPRDGVTLPNGDVTNQMDLAEIYEPEFSSQTRTCVTDMDCKDTTVPAPTLAIAQQVPLATSCLLDSDGTKRCLRACDPAATNVIDAECGDGYLCAETNTSTKDARDYRCMRSPLDVGLFTDCLKQLQHYQIRAGSAYSVIGSVSGFLSDLEPNATTRICEPPPISLERVRVRNPRIPLDAPLCPKQAVDAPAAATDIDYLTWVGGGGPNVCQHTALAPNRVFHFENPIMSFALFQPNDPSSGVVPADDTIITFVVVGGGFPLGLVLSLPSDTPAQSPKAMYTAPDQQTVFVVDEGKGTASTALRGQLLRLVSSVQTVDSTFRVR